MSFQDNEKNSVQSLLALLRSTQDGTSSAPPADIPPAQTYGASATAARNGRTLSLSRHSSGSNITSAAPPAVPSQQQLNDLLRSLNSSAPQKQSHPTPTKSRTSSGDFSAGQGSIGAKAGRTLIEPFGPVATAPISPSAFRKASQEHVRRESFSADQTAAGSVEPKEAVSVVDDGTVSFAKALPKLSQLLGDQRFMKELRTMKADQDALERRLWAKQEKVKAEHERSLLAEREIAKISQRPISAEKRAQWDANLDLNLQDFYRQTCLPSLDALSLRQKDRLKELGVPGLGGDPTEEGTVERWRRIMDLLQAGLEE